MRLRNEEAFMTIDEAKTCHENIIARLSEMRGYL